MQLDLNDIINIVEPSTKAETAYIKGLISLLDKKLVNAGIVFGTAESTRQFTYDEFLNCFYLPYFREVSGINLKKYNSTDSEALVESEDYILNSELNSYPGVFKQIQLLKIAIKTPSYLEVTAKFSLADEPDSEFTSIVASVVNEYLISFRNQSKGIKSKRIGDISVSYIDSDSNQKMKITEHPTILSLISEFNVFY